MGDAVFRPGDRVTILSGAFAGVSGAITTLSELTARWPDNNFADPVVPQPDIPTRQQVERGEAFWVIVRVFGHDVPVLLFAGQLTAEQQEQAERAAAPDRPRGEVGRG
jgi:hypothetical protein